MIVKVRRPQYFTSERSTVIVTRDRLFSEKVKLQCTFVTWAWDACGYLEKYSIILATYELVLALSLISVN